MLTTISTIVVAIALLFGGAGGTVYASQNSLPNDALYPMKTFGEDVRLALATNTQTRLELLLRFCDQRVAEIAGVTERGEQLREDTIARLQEQHNRALQSASELDDPAMVRALQQIELRLRSQEQRIISVRSNRPDEVGGALDRVREMLRQQLRQVDADLQDPAAFRQRFQHRLRPGEPAETNPQRTQTPGAPGTGPGPGPGPFSTPPCDTCTPALDGSGPGPGPMSTPTCDTCTPALDGTGPGPGPGHQGGEEQPSDDPSEGSGPSSPPAQEGGNQGTGSQNPAENPHPDNGSGGNGGNDSGNGSGGGGSNHP